MLFESRCRPVSASSPANNSLVYCEHRHVPCRTKLSHQSGSMPGGPQVSSFLSNKTTSVQPSLVRVSNAAADHPPPMITTRVCAGSFKSDILNLENFRYLMNISRIAGGLFEHLQIESRILACIKDDFFRRIIRSILSGNSSAFPGITTAPCRSA